MSNQPASSPSCHAWRGDDADPGRAPEPDATEYLCRCGLTLVAPPDEVDSWDEEKPEGPEEWGEPVCGYARYGEPPRDRHFIQAAGGWVALGDKVDEEGIDSAWPMSWEQARTCRHKVTHVMVAVYLSELMEGDE
jgi:hypothetical protein